MAIPAPALASAPEPAVASTPFLVNDDTGSALEDARHAEREATGRLRQLMKDSEGRLQESVRRLARFDAMVETIRSVLWKDGYLRHH